MTLGINLTYEQLLAGFPPRPITSDDQYWETVANIDELIDRGLLSSDEQDYLSVLGMLVERYEGEHEPDNELRGIALIRALMEEQGLRQRDLVQPIFKTDSIASSVLNGKRRLTVEHIDKLAFYFQLPHTLFFEAPENQANVHETGDGRNAISPPPQTQPSDLSHRLPTHAKTLSIVSP
jgi:HTH-type transcriptional regulator/antitoxin HigA